jgi:exosortase A-associated hydrolase 1
MEPDMRRLLTFACEGADLAASLDEGQGETGLILVTGGSQTRVGSHRMYERLGKDLADNGFSCLRFDRRGVGDSAGEDPGFRGSGPDLAAAAKALRRECKQVKRVFGFGLCDGATALALFGREAGLDGMILVNPWLVEAEADAPPPAAVRRHYRDRLSSRDGWKRLLSGAVDFRKLARGIAGLAKGSRSPLARESAAALAAGKVRAWLILAEGDATAIAAGEEVKARAFQGLIEGRETIPTDSHTFARAGDEAALLTAVTRAIGALSS